MFAALPPPRVFRAHTTRAPRSPGLFQGRGLLTRQANGRGGRALSVGPSFATKELSSKTWDDFQRLFLKKGRWGSCWCMIYHRVTSTPKHYTGPEGMANTSRDRRAKKSLVSGGRSHGILVYSSGGPVGWCQFGPKGELPLVDSSPFQRRAPRVGGRSRVWRVTCFWVERGQRGKGAATAALKAALHAIASRGGGVVEGYPALRKGFPADWTGTLSMFEREGFEVIAHYGRYNVLVRKRLRGARVSSAPPAPGVSPRRRRSRGRGERASGADVHQS